jgi:hypothetical protein
VIFWFLTSHNLVEVPRRVGGIHSVAIQKIVRFILQIILGLMFLRLYLYANSAFGGPALRIIKVFLSSASMTLAVFRINTYRDLGSPYRPTLKALKSFGRLVDIVMIIPVDPATRNQKISVHSFPQTRGRPLLDSTLLVGSSNHASTSHSPPLPNLYNGFRFPQKLLGYVS